MERTFESMSLRSCALPPEGEPSMIARISSSLRAWTKGLTFGSSPARRTVRSATQTASRAGGDSTQRASRTAPTIRRETWSV